MNQLNTAQEKLDRAITSLKCITHTLARHNEKGDFVCDECIDTIYALIGVITSATGEESYGFVNEICEIIGG